jgi:hypothetical protein
MQMLDYPEKNDMDKHKCFFCGSIGNKEKKSYGTGRNLWFDKRFLGGAIRFKKNTLLL